MAQQLTDAGEEVRALVFLDSPTADSPDQLTSRDKLLIHLQRLREQGAGYLGDWARARIQWEIEKRQAREEEASQSFEFRSAEIEAAFYRALGRYQTRSYSSPVTLYRPSLPIANRLGGGRVVNDDREFVYEDNSWSRYLDQTIEIVEVPGDHDSMVLEPNVRVLAADLKERLERG
jgi:thioesterase domain-containing protein